MLRVSAGFELLRKMGKGEGIQWFGGRSGIRTHGTTSAQRFSKPPRSATLAPFHCKNLTILKGYSKKANEQLFK